MDSESEPEVYEDALDDLTSSELLQRDKSKCSVKEENPQKLNCGDTLSGVGNTEDYQNDKVEQSEFDVLKFQDSDDSESSAEEDTFSHSKDVMKFDESISEQTQPSEQTQESCRFTRGFVTEERDVDKDMAELSKELIGINTNDIESSHENRPDCDMAEDETILSQSSRCDKPSYDYCSSGKDIFQGQHQGKRNTPVLNEVLPPTDSNKPSEVSQEPGKVKLEETPEWDNDAVKESKTAGERIAAQGEVIIEEDLMKAQEALMSEEEKEVRKEEGQALKADGNSKFKEKDYAGAIDLYTQGLQTCPTCYVKERSIMYSNRAACRFKLEEYELASKDCTKALELNPNYLKALLRRAECYEKIEKLDEALEDYQKAVSMDPSLINAREACMRLPEQIKERNEKMKTEMLGKLKELGNMVLKPFGLSTDNFQLQQDSNTGSYSVNFQQSQPKNGPQS